MRPLKQTTCCVLYSKNFAREKMELADSLWITGYLILLLTFNTVLFWITQYIKNKSPGMINVSKTQIGRLDWISLAHKS